MFVSRKRIISTALAGILLISLLFMVLSLFRIPQPTDVKLGSQVAQEQPPVRTPPDSPLETPTTIPVPYFTPTPAPTLPSVDQLEPGMKIVYGETDETQAKTIIWITNAANLESRKQIAVFEHRQGYPPTGRVSPDGKWVAIKLIPPNYSERGLRSYGGELWAVNTDGSNLHQLPGRVRGIVDWSPQGEVTIESGVDITNPKLPEDSVRPEYYAITYEGKMTKIMAAALENVAIETVGWSANGNEFYYAWRNMGVGDLALGTWELRGVNRAGEVRKVMEAPYKAARTPSLLASRTRLTYIAYTETEQLQVISNVTGERLTVLDQSPRSDDFQYWLWSALSPRSDTLLIRSLPKDDKNVVDLAKVEVTDGNQVTRQPAVETDASLIPVHWSPDESWIILGKAILDDTFASVLNLEKGTATEIPKSNFINWVTILGWVEN